MGQKGANRRPETYHAAGQSPNKSTNPTLPPPPTIWDARGTYPRDHTPVHAVVDQAANRHQDEDDNHSENDGFLEVVTPVHRFVDDLLAFGANEVPYNVPGNVDHAVRKRSPHLPPLELGRHQHLVKRLNRRSQHSRVESVVACGEANSRLGGRSTTLLEGSFDNA